MIIPPEDLPIANYHNACPLFLSKTSIRNFQEYGPAFWKMAYLEKSIEIPKPGGTEQGSALDCLMTEGESVFRMRYPKIPADAPKRPQDRHANAKNPSPATLQAAAWWAAWDAQHPGALELSDEDRTICYEARDAIMRHQKWPEVCAARIQHTVRRESAKLQELSKGRCIGLQSRIDYISPEGAAPFKVIDLKKTRDLSGFGRDAISLGYQTQAAIAGWCLAGEGITMEEAWLIAAEWKRGARCRMYRIPDFVLDFATRELYASAQEIAERLGNDDWQDRQCDNDSLLDIPAWMARNMGAE